MANVIPGATTGFYSGAGTGAAPTNGFYSTSTAQPTSTTPTASWATGSRPTPTALPSPTTSTPIDTGTGYYGGASGSSSMAPATTAADPNNYAGSGMDQADFEKTYGTNAQRAGAAENAGATAASTGNEVVNKVNPASPGYTAPGGAGYTAPPAASTPPAPGMLSGPGYDEAWFQQHGNDLSGPSSSKQLYDEGVSATNPFYQNAMDMAAKGINSQESMRGGGNSGAALEEIGMTDANLLGQQALAQGQLAGQADSADTSRFAASSGAATSAETQTNNRGAGAAAAYTGLSKDQADTVDSFYKMATSGQLTGDMASIEAQLAASGVDAATAQAITNDLMSLAGAGIKAASK